MEYGLSALKIGTYSKGQEDNKTAALSDFSPTTIEEMEDHCLPNTSTEPEGRCPYSIDFSKHIVKNQNPIWSLIYGVDRYPEGKEALDFLVTRNEGNPEFPTVPFLAAIWGRMAIDYAHKVMEGARCLTQLGRKIDGLEELKRLSRHSEGWKYPRTFSMVSGKRYWRRYVLPKIDLESGRAEYRGSLPEASASFGLRNQPRKNGVATEAVPKVNGKAKKQTRVIKNTALTQNTVTLAHRT